LNFTYSYDSAGNITQITDGVLNETHEYEYDFLNRLTHAEAYATGDPEDYKYRQGFVYDPLGNMLHMSDWIIPTPQAYREPGPFVDSLISFNSSSSNSHLALPMQQENDTETPAPSPTATPSETPTITPVPSNTPAAPPFTPTHWYGVDEYTSALLHMDGAEHSTTFIDETEKVWTPLGNVEMDADQYRFGSASAYFDGAGDFLRTASHDDFKFGSGDFTIDMWVRLNTTSGVHTLIAKRSSSSAYGPFVLQANNGQWQFVASNTGTSWAFNMKSGAAVANQWHHVAVVRHGNAWNLYVDGISVANVTTSSISVTSNATAVSIGANNDGSFPLNGQIDELRVSKGIARWTENFTPPDMPYGNTPAPTRTLTPTITLTPSPTPTPYTVTPAPSLTPSPYTITPTSSRTPTPTPQLGNLLAYWNFETLDGTKAPDEAFGDVFNNEATLYNGTTQDNGADGYGLYFNGNTTAGQNHYASVPNQAEISTNGSFTVSAWVNPASIVTTRTQYIVQKGGAARDYGLITVSDQGTPTPTGPVTVYHDGAIAFQIGDLNPNTLYGPVLPVDTWTMVTGVYDAACKGDAPLH
jgi:hypothetical protein